MLDFFYKPFVPEKSVSKNHFIAFSTRFLPLIKLTYVFIHSFIINIGLGAKYINEFRFMFLLKKVS